MQFGNYETNQSLVTCIFKQSQCQKVDKFDKQLDVV